MASPIPRTRLRPWWLVAGALLAACESHDPDRVPAGGGCAPGCSDGGTDSGPDDSGTDTDGGVDSGPDDSGVDSGGDGGVDSGGDSGGGDTGETDLPCEPDAQALTLADAAVHWTGVQELALTGENMRIIGDLDGDGIQDIAIGARGVVTLGFTEETPAAGALHLVYGGGELRDTDTSTLPTLFGAGAEDDFGYTMQGLGDIDGDGIDDLGVAARYAFSKAGQVFVVFGRSERYTSGVIGSVDDLHVVTGASFYDLAGTGLAGGFDHDGDGLDDFLIGAPFHVEDDHAVGMVGLVYGQADRDQLPTWMADMPAFMGIDHGGRLGTRFALGGGDLDGDGLAELAMGASEAEDPSVGEVYLFAGRDARRSNPALAVSEADRILVGPNLGSDARFGFGVDLGGDFDGDGYTDLAIGAYSDDLKATESGRVWLWRGGPTALDTITGTDDALLELRGATSSERLGRAVRLTGDVDDDGYAELLVGRIGRDTPATDTGSAMMLFGCPELSGVIDIDDVPVHWNGALYRQYLGYSLDMGDVTGDGRDDVVIGAPGHDGSRGQVLLYPGTMF